MAGPEKILVLVIFIACYALALSRRVKIAYASLGASALFLILGLLTPGEAVTKAIKWDVLGIYWGFMMVSHVFMKSRMPERLANQILARVKVERYAIFALCLLTAFLSAFMENVGVVLMMAPVAIAVAKRLDSSLFHYLIAIAVSSNVVTTVTMVADPPSIILAFVTWISVALSSFMDNVPCGILMIPVCQSLAASLGIEAWPLLYGMLIGTGVIP